MNGLCAGEPADQAAAPRRSLACRQSGALRKAAEYLATINLSSSAAHEFALKTLPRVKGRAPTWSSRVRPAARDHRAARRGHRERRGLVHQFSASSTSARSTRRPASTPSTPCLSCARASRRAISTSASTARPSPARHDCTRAPSQVRPEDREVPDLAAAAGAALKDDSQLKM